MFPYQVSQIGLVPGALMLILGAILNLKMQEILFEAIEYYQATNYLDLLGKTLGGVFL